MILFSNINDSHSKITIYFRYIGLVHLFAYQIYSGKLESYGFGGFDTHICFCTPQVDDVAVCWVRSGRNRVIFTVDLLRTKPDFSGLYKPALYNAPMLRPDYRQTGDLVLQNQNTLRKFVGILGISLPITMFLFLQIDSGFASVLPSISHYYYTRACGIFLISVSSLAVFLLIYKGEEPIDFYTSSIAGLFALCVLLFPTGNLSCELRGKFEIVSVTTLKKSAFREEFHYFSAAVFLASLAFMSFFLFTKSSLPPSKRPKAKVFRNRIYRICGVVMLLAMSVIFLGFLNIIPVDYYNEHCLTYWMEVVAVEAFGFSWMVKGNSFFTD